MSFVTSVLTEVGHAAAEMPFPPMVYGAIAVIVFAALGFVMLSYQNVNRRHAYKSDQHATHSQTTHPPTTHASHNGPEITGGGSGR